jgi:hypothetical protein
MDDQDVSPWKLAAVILGVVTLCAAAGFGLFLVTRAHANWDRVAGEWESYRLNETQMNWFRSVRSKQGVPCCDISDGHPTEMQRREDGIYIPDPLHVGGPWLLVPKEAMTTPGGNPVGVATVWYVIQIKQDDRYIHIRCFVPESET